MNKLQLLKEWNSEYLYQDIGYGGFNENGEFVVQGKIVKLTKQDIDDMYAEEVRSLSYEML